MVAVAVVVAVGVGVGVDTVLVARQGLATTMP
jgi:hypothetical protein